MRKALIITVIAVFGLAAVPGHTAQQSATYVGGTIAGVGVAGELVEGTGVAGYAWTLGFAPTRIRITDQAGPQVGWAVCQDDGDGICGQGNDILQDGCSTGDWQSLNSAFGAGETTVFIDMVSATCTGIGTTGTITIAN